MTKLADAIIVGGGIHGCSTALHMCLAGMKPVLIEKDYAGRHASGVNAGGVRQLARHVAEIPLSIRSMGIWERIEELVDDICGFESHGQVLVAENDAEFDACRARVAELNALGARVPALANRLANLPLNRWLLEKVAGIDRRRPLPALAP